MADTGGAELYAVAEAHSAPEALARFDAALDAAACAAVLLVAPPGHALDLQSAAPMIARAQRRGSAAVLWGEPGLAGALGADGAHLPWSGDVLKAYEEARGHLGASRIVGADAGRSRDAAMRLAEAGADYVSFGWPGRVAGVDEDVARDLDLVGWWADLFEIPCVAFGAASPDEARAYARAGANFVAARVPLSGSHDEIGAWFSAMAAAVAAPTDCARGA